MITKKFDENTTPTTPDAKLSKGAVISICGLLTINFK
jgi:hypothetical protein